MSEWTIPGYEVLGAVDLSQREMDSEAVALLLWDDETGLGLLWAQGCTCCCDMQDQLVPSEARIVEDLEATARELYDAMMVSDEPDLFALRAMIVAAQYKMGWTGKLPEIG